MHSQLLVLKPMVMNIVQNKNMKIEHSTKKETNLNKTSSMNKKSQRLKI